MQHKAKCRVRRADYEKSLHDDAGIKRPADEGVGERKSLKQDTVTGTLAEKRSTEGTTEQESKNAKSAGV
eukprot:1434291-Amphidinium_carterae.3